MYLSFLNDICFQTLAPTNMFAVIILVNIYLSLGRVSGSRISEWQRMQIFRFLRCHVAVQKRVYCLLTFLPAMYECSYSYTSSQMRNQVLPIQWILPGLLCLVYFNYSRNWNSWFQTTVWQGHGYPLRDPYEATSMMRESCFLFSIAVAVAWEQVV